jgi:hypothetical protein
MKFTSMFFKASEDYIRDSFSNIATNERDKQSLALLFHSECRKYSRFTSNIATNERDSSPLEKTEV